jgi:hypothetical protein
LACFLDGCGNPAVPPGKPVEEQEAKIRAALALLGPEDQKLAEVQRYCVVENDSRLGSMHKPYKLLVKDQPVFLCCEHCKKKALADPERTLAKAAALRDSNKIVPTP